MKLTIIIEDKSVYVDAKCFSNLFFSGYPDDAHALQWNDNSGWIEYTGGKQNEIITEIPEWGLNALQAWEDKNNEIPPAPTPPSEEENKLTAVSLLKDSDWVNQPDVTDVNNTPHLLNKSDFDQYRLLLRKIAVNPVDGFIDFPSYPQEQWSN